MSDKIGRKVRLKREFPALILSSKTRDVFDNKSRLGTITRQLGESVFEVEIQTQYGPMSLACNSNELNWLRKDSM